MRLKLRICLESVEFCSKFVQICQPLCTWLHFIRNQIKIPCHLSKLVNLLTKVQRRFQVFSCCKYIRSQNYKLKGAVKTLKINGSNYKVFPLNYCTVIFIKYREFQNNSYLFYVQNYSYFVVHNSTTDSTQISKRNKNSVANVAKKDNQYIHMTQVSLEFMYKP